MNKDVIAEETNNLKTVVATKDISAILSALENLRFWKKSEPLATALRVVEDAYYYAGRQSPLPYLTTLPNAPCLRTMRNWARGKKSLESCVSRDKKDLTLQLRAAMTTLQAFEDWGNLEDSQRTQETLESIMRRCSTILKALSFSKAARIDESELYSYVFDRYSNRDLGSEELYNLAIGTPKKA